MTPISVHLPCDSGQGIGGGFTFRNNLTKGILKNPNLKLSQTIEEADICLVAGPTMVSRQTIDKIVESKAKLVTRLDNVPRNSRNRNTGTSRLKEFAERADEVVWQCRWAREYLNDFIGREGVVIYNGVDDEVFTPEGRRYDPEELKGCDEIYMYSRFSRDETKRWEEAWYEFQLVHKRNPNAGLIIVGKFSPEQLEYNFDFFRGEKICFTNIVHDPNRLAEIYRGSKYFMATYFNDCYSNTILEALMCGVELVNVSFTGGTPELIKNFEEGDRGFCGLKRMTEDYEKLFRKVLEVEN